MVITKSQLKITEASLQELIPADYNPRSWTEGSLQTLVDSIRSYGPIVPLIVNSALGRENTIIGGHMRLEALKKLGYKTVPVIYVNIPDIEREKELCLRLNRNIGQWDYGKLAQNFTIDTLLEVGFDEIDFSNIYDDLLEVENDDFDVAKELEEIVNPTAQRGDCYQLGSHRILCGDSTNEEDVKTLMEDEKSSFIYSDPPYNIRISYDKGVSGKRSYGGKQVKDNKSDLEYESFLKRSIQNALSVATDDCHLFYWCDQRYIGLLQKLYIDLKIDPKRVCLWIKNAANPTPKIAFNKIFEPVVYGVRGKPYLAKNANSFHEILNKEVSNGNRLIDDILDLLDIWLVKRLPTAQYQHATQKPPELHEKPLRRCTKAGDIVLDLFGGSGSTLIACEQLKRKAYLIEIEPIFIDLIIKRYEKLTGIKARKLN